MEKISPQEARDTFGYDPETGTLTWKVCKKGRSAKPGRTAGSLWPTGYVYIRVHGKSYPAHRLIWLIWHGHWPAQELDHVNGVRSDNRIINLREATRGENFQNKARSSRNKSGSTGVSWDKDLNKWRAKICVNRKQIHLGVFSAKEDAAEAYRKAKAEHHTFNPVQRT